MKRIEIKQGQKFGRLTVIREVEPHINPKGQKVRMILCKCDCGNESTLRLSRLTCGITTSCGCLRLEKVGSLNKRYEKITGEKLPEGFSFRKSRIYGIWTDMLHRCVNPTEKNYYGKGISVCEEWRSDFFNFYFWAIANGYSDNLSIDRINNDKGYYPDNCRWATAKQQVNNTRVNHRITFNGETHTVSEWAQILNVTPMSIFRRLYKGWSEEEALTIPRFGKRTIQEEPITTQDIMNVCKQSISCGLCKNKKEFCKMSGISKYVFFSIQKGQYKISDGIYLKVKAMQDKILKIKESKEK